MEDKLKEAYDRANKIEPEPFEWIDVSQKVSTPEDRLAEAVKELTKEVKELKEVLVLDRKDRRRVNLQAVTRATALFEKGIIK